MKKMMIAVFVLSLLSGCTMTNAPVSTRSKFPVLEEPKKPVLEKMTAEELAEYMKLPQTARAKLEGNNDKLQLYSEQSVIAIREYNAFAKYANKLSDDALGVKTYDPEATKPPAK